MLIRYWVPLAAYMGLIFVQSSFAPAIDLPDSAPADKLVHLIMYAVLGALFMRAYLSLTNGRYGLRWAFASILSTILYSLTDEWHQSMVPGRSAEMLDLLANGIGAIIGVCAYAYMILHHASRDADAPD
jgi:VanZ family protein